jgi:DNA-binding ferritin-like protein
MKKEIIIQTLKDTYNRDLRKQVVKSILKNEKESETPDYKIINQIFSYILKELNWEMANSTKEWDNTPLDIMKEVFPKLESTKWFEEQILTAKKMIEIEIQD